LHIIPAKAGIFRALISKIPAYAGVTVSI
jgi:hypothetical protein